MNNISDLYQLLKERGLERLIPHAARLAEPAIRLILAPLSLDPWDSSHLASAFQPNDETPLGYSKVGGLPDLPADFVWPESESCALPFLAQFRLSDVAPHDLEGDLPTSGLLTFFYDHDAHLLDMRATDICRVFHIRDAIDLQRRALPDNIRTWDARDVLGNQVIQPLYLGPSGVQFRRELQLADDDALEFEAVAQQLDLSGDERVTWWQLSLDWSDQNANRAYMEIAKRELEEQEHPYHQLLGFPYCGNYDGRAEVTRENWETEAINWRLLFQLSSNDDLTWGDCDTISFFIRRDALQKRDFTDIRASYDG